MISLKNLSKNAQHGALRKKQAGYSLMEIMLAFTIVSLLLVSVLQIYRTLDKRSKINTANTMVNAIVAGIDNFRVDIGRYPTRLEELVTPPNDPQEKKRWQKDYIPPKYIANGEIIDPWGNPMSYELKPNKVSYELKSWGPDGVGAETGHIYANQD